MLIQTKALVIKENNVGEQDRLVTLLTEKAGVIRAFARGARSVKSKSLSATRLFCYSSMTVWASADKYVIREAEPIEVFFELMQHKNGRTGTRADNRRRDYQKRRCFDEDGGKKKEPQRIHPG